jgi:pimeloyl-ACP methyl ester carboxylesterase
VKLQPIIVASVLALLAPLASGAPPKAQERSCHLPGSEGALRCLTVPVALDHGNSAGPQLALHVTLAAAFRETARPDPLFILAGGPGQAGSDLLSMLESTFRRTRATRDIVMIDQRGTGRSDKLDCADRLDDDASEAELEAAVAACVAKLPHGLGAYSTVHAAHDIEQVRLALGYKKINLWGGSYGTRLAQQYARLYPGQVRAMILDGVAAPEQVIMAAGRDGQAALDLLFSQCAQEPDCKAAYPNLGREFTRLRERLEDQPIEFDMADPRTAAPLRVRIDSALLLSTVHSILYSAPDRARLPFLIHNAYRGRWQPFIARRNQGSDFSIDGDMSYVLHLAVVCAEDYPRLSAPLMAENASPLTAPQLKRIARLCTRLALPAVAWSAPTTIAAPVLMLSGKLDPVTPPRRAVAAARHMAHTQHLVVEHAGHGISPLGCVPRLLRQFLDRPERPVAAACLKDIPPTIFQLGSAGPQP